MPEQPQTTQQREFHCPGCNGRIVIPYALPATTAPCPKCQVMITSPPPPEAPLPDPIPEARSLSETNQISAARPAVIPPRREEQRDTVTPTENLENPQTESTEDSKSKSNSILAAMAGLLLLILAGGAIVFYITSQLNKDPKPLVDSKTNEDQEIIEANYLRIGWQKDALEVLEGFLGGASVEEKLPYIHRPNELKSKMERFYGGVVINDSDTPVESFSAFNLPEADRKRGIFLLTYDQPPQYALKEFFRPLATLEVQFGIDEADLLLNTLGRVKNFSMDPVRAHAFFKRTEDGLKLDWEVFAQTKYRTFRNFIELPDPDVTEVFRVLITEDVPDKGRGVTGTRTYRLMDPAHLEDSVRVNVKVDSRTGRALSAINWRGSKQTKPVTLGATVELGWKDLGDTQRPTLHIKQFFCWEFLGLGGQIPVTTGVSD
ncbi:MAG: hypothetical protein AB8D78_01900 [Akkermansiaceae bacterium]